jgi:hypothetical protein
VTVVMLITIMIMAMIITITIMMTTITITSSIMIIVVVSLLITLCPSAVEPLRMYLLLKGKLLDSLPPSARKGAEARNIMAASGKLQVHHHASHVTRHTSHAAYQPRNADTWSSLGHSLWEAGDIKDAFAVFSYALETQQVLSIHPSTCATPASRFVSHLTRCSWSQQRWQ